MAELQRGRFDEAWDLFLDRYRRLVFAAIRHYAQDYDDVMDVFARACEALRADNLRRLRSWVEEPEHRARFSTWLVMVVRHLTVDWFRHRDGRKRLSAIATHLPLLQRRIFECVFADGRSHVETYELLSTREAPGLSFVAFLRELRATYRAVAGRRRGALMAELWGPLPPQEIEPALVDALGEAEYGPRLAEALESLPPDDRLAIQLFVVDELPAADVARVLGFPNAKTVYNRVYRALADLRVWLERVGVSGVDL